ncbi:histone H4 transcription factor [Danaus plexippus]|uniref:MBD2 n=1 Tax=Danaus plexippus plexippus TaxID=278856 RepID=A0A212ERI1_DANPL|nr:histone H4 transcription factor [Danaus plexippus]OWR44085.1 putative MBD2 [Danaus plexippus plexippus]
MEETVTNASDVDNFKLKRCTDWLLQQNNPDKLTRQNQNDIQFIIETNAHRKKFFLSAAEDEATVPTGVDENTVEPATVPLARLRKDNIRMECEWQSCRKFFTNYEVFQKHVTKHASDLHVIDMEGDVDYVCLWDICGHRTKDFVEMVRHISYHAYHARLLAIGYNARATLKLDQCKKDSSRRNRLPSLKSDHCCMWIGCSETFFSIQTFLDHMKHHIFYSDDYLCSWAGCGATFTKRHSLVLHLRSHTQEKTIACFHCGRHFTCNRKLSDHLARQNVDPSTGYPCNMCGTVLASAYLQREHARQHVSAYACTLCDMSATTPAALAHHVRYRHLADHARSFACPHCVYRAVTKCDLRKHILTHTRKAKKKTKDDSEDSDVSDAEVKKKKEPKKYVCHLCQKDSKIFSRGTRLTTHLVKVHGAQWPFGHSRFRYQISEDGMYRLTTTRFEVLEVSKKIVDGYSGPKESLTNTFEFDLKQTADATETTPKRFEITLKNTNKSDEGGCKQAGAVEIMMCDVDQQGNIISTETIKSDVVYT